MSTEQPNPTPTPDQTPSPLSNNQTPNPDPNAKPEGDQQPKPEGDSVKPGDKAPEGGDKKPDDKPADEGDLLFKKGDKKPDDKAPDAKPDAAGQRKYLTEKATDDAAKKALEGKTDEEIAKLFDDEKAKEDAANPEKVAFKFDDLKIPETMKVTEDIKGKVGELAEIFNDKTLTKSQKMQKAIDLHVETQNQINTQWADTKKGWRDECRNDKVIGGEKLTPAVASTEAVVATFAGNPKFGGSPELMQEMQEDLVLLGLGNKRSFIRMMNNIAKATGEDKFDGNSGGGKEQGDGKSKAQRIWPNMPGDKPQ